MNVNKLMGNDPLHKGVMQTANEYTKETTDLTKNTSKTTKATVDMRELGKGNKIDFTA